MFIVGENFLESGVFFSNIKGPQQKKMADCEDKVYITCQKTISKSEKLIEGESKDCKQRDSVSGLKRDSVSITSRSEPDGEAGKAKSEFAKNSEPQVVESLSGIGLWLISPERDGVPVPVPLHSRVQDTYLPPLEQEISVPIFEPESET